MKCIMGGSHNHNEWNGLEVIFINNLHRRLHEKNEKTKLFLTRNNGNLRVLQKSKVYCNLYFL
jgi:hypothetical protein